MTEQSTLRRSEIDGVKLIWLGKATELRLPNSMTSVLVVRFGKQSLILLNLISPIPDFNRIHVLILSNFDACANLVYLLFPY